MFLKRLQDCREITATDGTRLRELLHPERDAATVRYSLARARLAPGTASLPHRLTVSEVYYLVRGRGLMHVGDEAADVRAGDAVFIPPGAEQWLENTGKEEVVFLCIVDPAWTAAAEEPAARS